MTIPGATDLNCQSITGWICPSSFAGNQKNIRGIMNIQRSQPVRNDRAIIRFYLKNPQTYYE